MVSLFKMRITQKILMILITHFIIMNGFGQDIPWNFKITGTNHTLFIDSFSVIEIEDYSGSGVLGVFYDSLGVDVCAGYVELNGTDDYLVAYGETGNKNGVSAGERFKFKLWDRNKDCIYDNLRVEYKSTAQAPNAAEFVNDGISNIISIKANPIKVEYPVELICPGQDFISPDFINSGDNRFLFSADAGLNIDSSTGRIDAAESQPGTYKIRVISKYCISNPDLTIRISANIEPDIPGIQYKCPGDMLDVNAIMSETTDFWAAPDSLNVSNTLDTGIHILKLSNPDGCIVEKNIEVLNYPEQEILYETDYDCESTTIRLTEEQGLSGIEWSNMTSDNAIEVFENSNIELYYTDANQCNRTKSINVEVKKLQIQSLQTRVIPADCYFKGRIEINNANIENNIGNFRYEFVNRLTNESFQSADQLPEGKYQINVLDERDCLVTWNEDILIPKDCLNDRPVFTPNDDYIDDTYYIPETGTARVYNRNGSKVAEFETPIYWDGTDNQGQKLPMGTYLIVINDEKVINITILK